MQTVSFNIIHLTGKGWRHWSGTITVDETIGIKAGRDEYSVARGTVMKLMRKTLMAPGTRASLLVNNQVIEIWIENGRFCHSMFDRFERWGIKDTESIEQIRTQP